MKKLGIISTLVLVLSTLSHCQHTFSIIAVDTITQEIGSAGATCIPGSATWGGIDTIINHLIPGRGGINSQAWVCIPNINMHNGINEMRAGSSPDEVLAWLITNDRCSAANFSPQSRQYGIVDLDDDGSPRTTAFTGDNADDYKGHIIGRNYAIQGNILLGPEVLEGMEAGFNSVDGPLHAKLMAAMQGANIAGADSRCLPFGTSSTTSYLKVTKPTDIEGQPYISLNNPESPQGVEPIDVLQQLYDDFLATSNTSQLDTELISLSIFPNPVSNKTQIRLNSDLTIIRKTIYDLSGRRIVAIENNSNQLDLSKLNSGNYLLKVELNNGRTESLKLNKK